MKPNRCIFRSGRFIILLGLFVFPHLVFTQIPSSLDGKVDMLAEELPYSSGAQQYFIQLGSGAVPIVTKKLIHSLAESSSVNEPTTALIQMSAEHRKQAEYQLGLVIMESIALDNMSLPQNVRASALNSLYESIHSPYRIVRKEAVHYAGVSGHAEAIASILPLLNDSDEAVRYQAAETLGTIGDKATAQKILQVLGERRGKLTNEQLKKDSSFKKGYETADSLNAK